MTPMSFLAWLRPREGGLGFILLGLIAGAFFLREKEPGALLFLGLLPLLAAGLLFMISSGKRFKGD